MVSMLPLELRAHINLSNASLGIDWRVYTTFTKRYWKFCGDSGTITIRNVRRKEELVSTEK
jgi:hypothetical protein